MGLAMRQDESNNAILDNPDGQVLCSYAHENPWVSSQTYHRGVTGRGWKHQRRLCGIMRAKVGKVHLPPCSLSPFGHIRSSWINSVFGRAGLQPGDVVLMVNGKSCQGSGTDTVCELVHSLAQPQMDSHYTCTCTGSHDTASTHHSVRAARQAAPFTALLSSSHPLYGRAHSVPGACRCTRYEKASRQGDKRG